MKDNQQNEETKEDFCPSCVAVPLAFAGVGASAYGSQSNGKYRKNQKIMLCIGISTIILSILIFLYFRYVKNCKGCR